jgi:protein gp37
MFHPSRLDQPLRWKKPRRIFVCSMGDLFHKDVPYNAIIDTFDRMEEAEHHTFMVLTKRPQRMREFIMAEITHGRKDIAPTPNVWLGATVENMDQRWRMEELLMTPAAKRFISAEPLLGPLEIKYGLMNGPFLQKADGKANIDWVICGGETGPGARFMHPHWVENLRDQCTEAGVPFFFKGWGTKMMKNTDPGYMKIDGREWKEFPERIERYLGREG